MGGGEPWRGVSEVLLTAVSRLLPAVTIEVEVALAPEHPYPAPIDDLLAALDWVLGHTGELGVDPGGIALAGASSGANTAVAAAIQAPVAALGLWVPSLDLTHYGSAHAGPEGRAARDQQPDGYLAGAARTLPTVSPALADDLSMLPPTVLVTAEFDEVVAGGEQLAERLAAQHIPVRHLTLPVLHGVAPPLITRQADQFVIDGLRELLR